MKLVRELACHIEEEICDVKEYSMLALEVKLSNPELAQVLHQISVDEYQHYKLLHEKVVKIIADTKEQMDGNVPTWMLKKWDCEHKYLIELEKEAKVYMDLYQ